MSKRPRTRLSSRLAGVTGSDTVRRFLDGPERYRLKVTLRDVQPAVWRRIVVSSDITFAALHDVLQIAIGWTNSHLHAFDVAGIRLEPLDPRLEPGPDSLDTRATRLRQLVGPRKPRRFVYDYDFGDCWQHDIVLESVLPDEGGSVAVCTAGARACPPEDCGGSYGYAELLVAIRKRSHPRHDELREWMPDGFDPEAFDMAAVNRRLAHRR